MGLPKKWFLYSAGGAGGDGGGGGADQDDQASQLLLYNNLSMPGSKNLDIIFFEKKSL